MTKRSSSKRTWGRLSNDDVLRLLRDGAYWVDEETGIVYGQKGQPLSQFTGGRSKQVACVCLHEQGRRRVLTAHSLVWISVTGEFPPPRFEIHHDDEDPTNNTWHNLYCMHPNDHDKLHGRRLRGNDDSTPF